MKSGLLHRLLNWVPLAFALAGFIYILFAISTARGIWAGISMIACGLILSTIRGKAEKKAESVDYSRR